MKDIIAQAMGRALDHTRAGNPAEATRILQDALNGRTPATQEAEGTASAKRRRPLGQVIASLANSRPIAEFPLHRPGIRPELPEGAGYETRCHDSAFGSRDYRLFVPSGRAEPVGGLVMMLHGCTQNADDFATGTRMNLLGERHNLVVVYPDQARQANHMGCWNWFDPQHQRHGRGEPALLADLAAAAATEFAVPERKVFVAGLSAGGAMAAILGAEHPEVFAAVGVHSGLAPGSATDVASAFAAMKGHAPGAGRGVAGKSAVRTIVFHGDADTTVVPANAEAVVAAARGAESAIQIVDTAPDGVTVTLHRDTAGRTLAESWRLPGVGHAWSGGSAVGSYTHPAGPDASAEMVRFFLDDEDRR